MAYNNPLIVPIPDPTGVDSVIETIREDIALIPWMEKSFGRAWPQRETAFRSVQRLEGGEYRDVQQQYAITVPMVYQRKGEYINVLANDFLQAQSFFDVTSEERWLSTDDAFNRRERDLALIVWVNLKEIDPAKDYVFTEELKKDVEDVLKSNNNLIQIQSYTDQRVEEVFRGYSINDVETQYMMFPYAAFRFDLTANYLENGNC